MAQGGGKYSRQTGRLDADADYWRFAVKRTRPRKRGLFDLASISPLLQNRFHNGGYRISLSENSDVRTVSGGTSAASGMAMDSSNLWGWVAIAAAAYFFSKTFRREVNGWIVRLADKVRHDTPDTQPRETHILEDVAFMKFEQDYPNDPRIKGGWHNLPPDIRSVYIQKAITPLIPPDNKTNEETKK